MKKQKVIEIIKKNYPFLKAEFNIDKIGIFGSVAKDTSNSQSDIDIVIKLKSPLGLKFISLVDFLESILKNKVDVLTLDGINNIRYSNISDDILRNIIYV